MPSLTDEIGHPEAEISRRPGKRGSLFSGIYPWPPGGAFRKIPGQRSSSVARNGIAFVARGTVGLQLPRFFGISAVLSAEIKFSRSPRRKNYRLRDSFRSSQARVRQKGIVSLETRFNIARRPIPGPLVAGAISLKAALNHPREHNARRKSYNLEPSGLALSCRCSENRLV